MSTSNRPSIARTALLLGVAGSLAFNIAWAWPRPVLVGVGLLMAFTLPVAVSLWRASGHVTGWARFERAAVMSFIAVGAGTYTEVHATLLLRDAGLPVVIAWLPALVGEALVVMAARASAPQQKPPVTRAAPKRELKPKPETALAPPAPRQRVTAGETELVVADDGTAFEALVIPEDASPQEKRRLQASNRQRKARARKAVPA